MRMYATGSQPAANALPDFLLLLCKQTVFILRWLDANLLGQVPRMSRSILPPTFAGISQNFKIVRAIYIAFIGLMMALISGCVGYGPTTQTLEVQSQHDTFSALCYQSAGEFINGSVSNINTMYFSPPSTVVGAWDFELFYGVNEPKKWGPLVVQRTPPKDRPTPASGAYEVRYTYLPIEKQVEGKVLRFQGVRQEIFDLLSGQVIARRENYIWGRDFNRSTFCLGANWYSGNEAFVERVLGPRYTESSRQKQPERYIKAELLRAEDADVTLENYWYKQENALPAGSVYDYNHRTIVLPDGKFYMPSYWNAEPISIIGTLIQPNQYIFVMLPGGHGQNWPLRQILLSYRDKQGNSLKNVFVQLPPVFDWRNGWGMRPIDVVVVDNRVEFSIFGKKVRTSNSSDQNNAGHYLKKYTFVASVN